MTGKNTRWHCLGTFLPDVHYVCTYREIFSEILLNQTQIRLYLTFSDWFGTKRTVFVWFQNQSENVKYNLIWVWFNKISEKKILCMCMTWKPGIGITGIIYKDWLCIIDLSNNLFQFVRNTSSSIMLKAYFDHDFL